MEQGMKDLEFALKEKQTEEHTVIDEAIRDKAEVCSHLYTSNRKAYTVFSVPVGVIYRPSEAKIKNAQKKDYLGEAKLIAATDARDGFTGFTGAEIKKVIPVHSIYHLHMLGSRTCAVPNNVLIDPLCNP
jgi:hypothetical protein